MSNGHPWLPSHTAILERMAGRPDREIAEATGQPMWKVRERRQALGLKAYSGRRENWDSRDWAFAGIFVLDIRPALFPF